MKQLLKQWAAAAFVLAACSTSGVATAQTLEQPEQDGEGLNPVSPTRNIQPALEARRPPRPPQSPDVRSIDGTGNNIAEPEMGATFTPLIRSLRSDYGDGIATLAGENRPSARAISNIVCHQEDSKVNDLGASDYLWQWGQFLDHDIDLTDGTDPPESADIEVPAGDPWFDPAGTGTQVIALNRSVYDTDTGVGAGNPRQQLNLITAWIDGSQVYGSDEERAAALRTLDGTGMLKTSAGGLLPFNEDGLPNAGGSSASLFLAGDVRANEQVALTAMHTLFVREHNRIARRLARDNPGMGGEAIYQRARKMVGALIQAITYQEYLPALMGRDAIPPYRGYRSDVEAGIMNLFSTATYRYGHSALSSTLQRLDAQGREIPAGHLELRDAFFSPQRITDEGGIDPILRGLAAQVCQAVDPLMVDDVRNFLFGPPGSGGFDLAALNIQRGRDHGLPSYNEARQALGMPRARRFGDITSDPEMGARLREAYGDVNRVDIWVGALAEDPVPGSHVGPMIQSTLRRQFEALRDGDRFWYERDLPLDEVDRIRRTRLSDVIRRNTGIGNEIPDDVFHVRPPGRR